MHLGTPKSAIVSAIIFNALIIPALVPLALKGVKYRAIGATALLRNLLIYGLGGVILPFVGIKLIDLLVHNLCSAHERARSLSDPGRDGSGNRQDLPYATGGQQAADLGRDVAIGYLEPHERAATAAIAEGMEVVPRLRASARRPGARRDGRRRGDRAEAGARPRRRVCPHERAGCGNAKRYEDIDEILVAGINVVSTVTSSTSRASTTRSSS